MVMGPHQFINRVREMPLLGNKDVLWFFGSPATGEPSFEASMADIYWRGMEDYLGLRILWPGIHYMSLVAFLCVILYFIAYKYWRADNRRIVDAVFSVLLVFFATATWQRHYLT